MLRGIYAAATGLVAEMHRQDVVANNLANADTAGFKRLMAVSRPLGEMQIRVWNDRTVHAGTVVGPLGLGQMVVETATAFTQGGLRHTGNDTDLALVGDGFFTIAGPGGREFYTRDGSFVIDRDGYLVTVNGDRVLGANGPLQVGQGRLTVEADGTVRVNGADKGRLRLAAFTDNRVLSRVGHNLWSAPAGAQVQASGAAVRQGYLEGANVQPVREMVDLIALMRAYEAGQKVIMAHDQMLEQAVSEIARLQA